MDKTIRVGAGEFIDRVSILEIKIDRIKDKLKLKNIQKEFDCLWLDLSSLISNLDVRALYTAIKLVNMQLWDVEDQLRDHELKQDFGAEFVELARSVYKLNDKRSELKKQINLLCGSNIIEEKSYKAGGNIG